jgi:hypothetical protein
MSPAGSQALKYLANDADQALIARIADQAPTKRAADGQLMVSVTVKKLLDRVA